MKTEMKLSKTQLFWLRFLSCTLLLLYFALLTNQRLEINSTVSQVFAIVYLLFVTSFLLVYQLQSNHEEIKESLSKQEIIVPKIQTMLIFDCKFMFPPFHNEENPEETLRQFANFLLLNTNQHEGQVYKDGDKVILTLNNLTTKESKQLLARIEAYQTNYNLTHPNNQLRYFKPYDIQTHILKKEI